MPVNARCRKVTMRHPNADNELVCFDFQVDHHKSLGWKVADEAPVEADEKKPKPKPAKADTPNPPKEG